MPQSLTQLPKTADVDIAGCDIYIRDHKVVTADGLFGAITWIVSDGDSNRETLYQFEKYGINFESAIECCAHELECDVRVLIYAIMQYAPSLLEDRRELLADFLESRAGRAIADMYAEKIRSCSNWGELYDEMDHKSKFQKDVGNKINADVDQWLHSLNLPKYDVCSDSSEKNSGILREDITP